MHYANGKIYKVVSNQTDGVYYGSTIDSLSKRHSRHKSDYKLWLDGRHTHMTSFDIIKEGDSQIFLVETYPCETKEELHARERFWIENNPCVNKQIPSRTKREYRETHKEHKKLVGKTYYENNKEALFEKSSVKIDCECGGSYTIYHKQRHFRTKRHQSYVVV